MAAVPVNIFVGAPVLVDDPNLGSIYGEIFWINKSEVSVHTSSGKTVVTHFSKISPKDFYNIDEFFDSFEEPFIIQETQLKIQGRNIEEQIKAIVKQEETESSKQKHFLAMCISQNLSFSDEIPVTARVLHKCLLQWRSFEAEKTSVFDEIIKEISSQITKNKERKDRLAYWLSNLNTLLICVIGVAKEIKTKFPASKFRQNLVICLDETYEKIRKSIKNELSHAISLCIQESRISQEITVVGSSSSQASNGLSENTLIGRWQNVKKILDDSLETLKANHVVSKFIVGKLFNQLFAFINVELFNSIFSNSERCSFSYGENVKAGLSELQLWCYDAKEYAGLAEHELKHIEQATELLLLKDKSTAKFKNITREFYPDLNLQQLHLLCTTYNDDTNNFSSDVLTALAQTSSSASDLLEDDSSIPFSLADISKSMMHIDQVDFDLAAFIRDDPKLVMLLP